MNLVEFFDRYILRNTSHVEENPLSRADIEAYVKELRDGHAELDMGAANGST